MWTRAELKENAKAALPGKTYWKALVVSILVELFSINFSYAMNLERLRDSFLKIPSPVIPWVWHLFPFFELFMLFVTNVVLIGLYYYFIRNHYGEANIANLFHGFRSGYLHIVGVQFVTDLIIFLWSLLFIIPGIMAGYKYRFVPYLLSENPYLNGKEARQLSALMTDGQKWDIFILDLSFLGWYLLGLICFLVGYFLILPYQHATNAELYLFLRDSNHLKFTSDVQEGEPDASMET